MRPIRHEEGVQEVLVPIQGLVTRLELHVHPIPVPGGQRGGRDDDVVVPRLPLDGGAVHPHSPDAHGRVLEVQDQVVRPRVEPLELGHERTLERHLERPGDPQMVGVVDVGEGPGAPLGQRPGYPFIEQDRRPGVPPARHVGGEGRHPDSQDTVASEMYHGGYPGKSRGV